MSPLTLYNTQVVKGVKYTISFDALTTNGGWIGLRVYLDEDINVLNSYKSISPILSSHTFTFTTTKDGQLIISDFRNKGFIKLSNINFTTGSTPPPDPPDDPGDSGDPGDPDSYTINGIANVMEFGAKGDGSKDDTNAIKSALSSSSYVFFPSGKYNISDTLTLDGQKIVGAGVDHTTIFSLANKPIFHVKGQFGELRDMRLQYSGWDQSSQTNRNAVEFTGKNAYHTFENLRFVSVYRAFHINQNSNEIHNAFSINVRNIYCFAYWKNVINMVPSQGGLSGSVFENIYSHNGNRDNRYEQNVTPFVFHNTAEVTLTQLNAEWSNITSAFEFKEVRNAVLISPHIEGTDLYGDAWYDIRNSHIQILGNRTINNYIHSNSAVYKVTGGSSLKATNLNDVMTSIKSGSMKVLSTLGGQGNSVEIDGFKSTTINNIGDQPANGNEPVFKRYNYDFLFMKNIIK